MYLGAFNTILILLFGVFAQAAVQTSFQQIQAGTGTIAGSDAWQIAKSPQGSKYVFLALTHLIQCYFIFELKGGSTIAYSLAASDGSGNGLEFISIPTTMQLAITQGLQTTNITPSSFSAFFQTGT